ncbi:MAG: APC family permease [Armatimonadetes bacterium]|nr:APC family permease [Armatimonadota bacterium]
MAVSMRRALIGAPLATARAAHERLNNWLGLSVFASDNLSSSAYATEAILLVIAVEGSTRLLAAALPITIGIVVLTGVVALSYRQTVQAYPTGGGAYIVARENLGMGWATTAGAALLIDYVLTVAVSVAAGVQAMTSAFTVLQPWAMHLGVAAVLLIALANLRGVRESGLLFAVPTYSFVFGLLLTLGIGIVKVVTHAVPPPPEAVAPMAALGALPFFLVLRAFASGCAALTGIEAISNGVQAFRSPEGRNAAVTMLWMAGLLLTLFTGITVLARAYAITPDVTGGGHGVGETVVSQVAAAVWGGKNIPYLFVQFATMAILIVAANTSFADFPRLSAILARDRWLPRQLANVGDRLVYNNGILVLAGIAIVLLIAMQGNVHALLPLYMVGVFVSFTLSQAGMVRRWLRLRTPGWRQSAIMNGFGSLATGIVLIVVAITKFHPPEAHPIFSFTVDGHPFNLRAGAWLVVALIPLMVAVFYRIHDHYNTVSSQLTLIGFEEPPAPQQTVIVLVPSINRGIVPALRYARAMGHDTRALHIEIDPDDTPRLRDQWEQWSHGIPLLIIESPYRSLIDPLFRYLDEVQTEPNQTVTLVIPEFVPVKWWHKLLHNQSGLLLKIALLFRRGLVVTNVRYHLTR